MSDPLSLERWEQLPAVAMGRRVLREAFGVELVLTGSRGPAAHARGGVLRSSSEACRVALFTREGFARCDAFYRGLTAGGHVCPLGLYALAEPVIVGGEVVAHAAVSGFGRGADDPDRGELLRRLGELDPGVTPDAVRRLPIVEDDHVVRAILRCVAAEIAAHEDRRVPEADGAAPGMWGIVGRSPQMQRVFELLPRLADSHATALVLGESGTGKELVARALHERGRRREGPFVAQSCAALPADLLESALFGHVRGAFSGATRGSAGLFGAADGGTLFLDEVGEMSPALQVKLLRVLQDGTYLPVGATTPRRADVRVVAATHRDLAALVQEGTFRADLFYRLHVLPVRLPPLRDRAGDLPVLVDHFRGEVRGVPPVSRAAWRCLERYPWPGNVRELQAEVHRWQLVAADAAEVVPEHLSPPIRDAGGYDTLQADAAQAAARGEATLAEAVEALERAVIERGLARTGGNRSRLAKELNISRTTLAQRLRRYGLD